MSQINNHKPSAKSSDRNHSPRQPARNQPALTTRYHERVENNPLSTPALQAHLRALKRAEYKSKSREDLSPSHNFPYQMRPIHEIGQSGRSHINTARWTDDDLSSVFSMANSIPFHFTPFDAKVHSLFHVYAFLFSGARQVSHLLASGNSSLDALVRGKPAVFTNRFALFAYAVYLKISQTPDLTAIAQSTNAPFDYYIVKSDPAQPGRSFRRRIYESPLISQAYEEARRAVKEDRLPNLVPFFDLDYQLELEEISDFRARQVRVGELIDEASAEIREKVKKAVEKMKAPAATKGEKKRAQTTAAASVSELTIGTDLNVAVVTNPTVGEDGVVQSADVSPAAAEPEDPNVFNSLVYTGEPVQSQAVAQPVTTEPACALEQAQGEALALLEEAAVTPIVLQEPAPGQERVIVLDGFVAAPTASV